MPPIPAMREVHHSYIENTLRSIAKMNSLADTLFPVTNDSKLNQSIHKNIRIYIHNMRAMIESRFHVYESNTATGPGRSSAIAGMK